MLVELQIRDLALIETATLHFGAGLNVITGETGAGKSLLIDALELLLGQRARSGMVRAGAPKATVEGSFLLPGGSYAERVNAWLREHLPAVVDEPEEGADSSGDLELILTRTLGRDGRTRAHVNHRPVTQRMLLELAALLVEIHGQNDHQRLFEPSEQLRLLDTYGGHAAALAGYSERRTRWIALAERLASYESGEADRLQRLDLLRFQLNELSEADPSTEEQQGLLAERARLRNAEELGRRMGSVLNELSESERSALDVLRRAEREVGEWEERVGELAAPAASLREASAHLEEAAAELMRFMDGVEVDPRRLEEVETRLNELERLERKYRTNIAGLVGRLDEIGVELEQLESASSSAEDLSADSKEAHAAVLEAASRLGKSRRKLRGRLQKAVEKALAALGLARASFKVGLEERSSAEDTSDLETEKRRLGATGLDAIEFLLAANPGEEMRPLRKVASGGEMARIMLALRGALAVRQSTPTLIFDEVDTGVGGRLGPEVGNHLRGLAEMHQILCVTHLPAIAACAHRHLRVHKDVVEDRTRTHIVELTGEERVQEVADMIAGGAEQETARAEARRLLGEV